MHMSLSIEAPRLNYRVADGLGVVPGGASPADLKAFRAAGGQMALSLPQPLRMSRRRAPSSSMRSRATRLRLELQAALSRPYASAEIRSCLAAHARMLAVAETEARAFLRNAHRDPLLPSGRTVQPRVGALAAAYLDASDRTRFTEETFGAFLRGVQEGQALQLGELRAARGALMLELLERAIAASTCEDPARLAAVVDSLGRVEGARWTELLASVSLVDRALAADPAGEFGVMDDSRRDDCRTVVAYLARHGTVSEPEVAEAAVSVADAVADTYAGATTNDVVRRMHVSYYLLDEGRPTLEALVGFRPPLLHRLAAALTSRRTATYHGGGAGPAVAVLLAILSRIDAAEHGSHGARRTQP